MENWQDGTCALSQRPCKIDRYGDATRFHSSFGGGTYVVTRSALAGMEANPQVHPRLMRWVYEQNLAGNEWPNIDTNNKIAVSSRKPLSASQRVREFLLFIRQLPTDREFKFGTIYNFQFDGSSESKVFSACDLEVDHHSLLDVRRNAIEAGYLDQRNQITFSGHQYLEAFEKESLDSSQAFVAMWFDPNLSTSLYELAIEPSTLRAGYKTFRVDRKEHVNRIDDEIVGEIRRSRFLIADFTCPIHDVAGHQVLEHRGGVYFEAGLAQGLGLPVIWTCNAELIGSIHFDTRQYNHLLWDHDKLAEFGVALERRIRAVVGQGPLT